MCDLASVVDREHKLVSHHVRVLREAGQLASRREGKMMLYRLTATGRELLDGLLHRAEDPA